jgi:tetratricopeptide (TPR) repeat protein
MNAPEFLVVGPDRPAPRLRRSRRDYRLWALVGILVAIGLLGMGIKHLPSRGVIADAVPLKLTASPQGFETLPAVQSTNRTTEEVEQLMEPSGTASRPQTERERANATIKLAAKQIREKRPEDAIRTLNAEQGLLKDDPRAYYYLAKALRARGDAATARDFYQKAIDLDPALTDAYFGFAEAAEAQGDLESALGGMRSFIHVSRDADPYRLRIAQARSAIWEWEAKLGRGPWGPTEGVPPGFTADEIKRDGKGVGIKMQKVETLRSDGTMDAEMKGQTKFKIFKRE